jgi:hypothetical protein
MKKESDLAPSELIAFCIFVCLILATIIPACSKEEQKQANSPEMVTNDRLKGSIETVVPWDFLSPGISLVKVNGQEYIMARHGNGLAICPATKADVAEKPLDKVGVTK